MAIQSSDQQPKFNTEVSYEERIAIAASQVKDNQFLELSNLCSA